MKDDTPQTDESGIKKNCLSHGICYLEEEEIGWWIPLHSELEPERIPLPGLVYEYHESINARLGRKIGLLPDNDLSESVQPCTDGQIQLRRNVLQEDQEKENVSGLATTVSPVLKPLQTNKENKDSKDGIKLEINGTRVKKKHKYNRICTYPGCKKQTKKSALGHVYCIGHGGGFKCIEPQCLNAALQASTRCIRHGGGKCCIALGCKTTARQASSFCGAHRILFANFECLMNPCAYEKKTLLDCVNLNKYGRNASRKRSHLAKVVERKFARWTLAKRKEKLRRFRQFETIRNNVSMDY